jgi:ADP-heptose:LPS heptosyltransferase
MIHQSNQGAWHFSQAFTQHLAEVLKIGIPFGECKGDIYVSDAERSWFSQVHEITSNDNPFWLIVGGGKSDFTCKSWSQVRFQSVVDQLQGKVQFVQIGDLSHRHPGLKNVIDLRGKTDVRQLIRLVYHSAGILCPVTFLMHLAAAVPVKDGRLKTRPCVVLCGGREPMRWEAYTGHQFLHTCGALPCCDHGGCWKSRVMPIGDNDDKDFHELCENVHIEPSGEHIPKCLAVIEPVDVVRAINVYLEGEKMWSNWSQLTTDTKTLQDATRKALYPNLK